MGSGISTSRQKAANQTIKDSESVVGQSLASVLSSPDGRTTGDNERLQYPENVHAALDVERYVVDENGLRCETPKMVLCTSTECTFARYLVFVFVLNHCSNIMA